MDALASLAFGIVILNSIQKRGISERKQLTKYTLRAGIVAGSSIFSHGVSFNYCINRPYILQ